MGVLGGAVCVGALLGRSLVAWVESNNHKQEIWYPSPDGKYVARYKMEAGGLAISSFCNESISVYSVGSAHLPVTQGQDHQIYGSSCQSVAIDGRSHLQWINNDTFRIKVPIQRSFSAKFGGLVVDIELKVGGGDWVALHPLNLPRQTAASNPAFLDRCPWTGGRVVLTEATPGNPKNEMEAVCGHSHGDSSCGFKCSAR